MKIDRGAIPKPTHDADWWGSEDQKASTSPGNRVDADKFNRVIWEGLMESVPIPRSARALDLRQNREQLLKNTASHSTTTETVGKIEANSFRQKHDRAVVIKEDASPGASSFPVALHSRSLGLLLS